LARGIGEFSGTRPRDDEQHEACHVFRKEIPRAGRSEVATNGAIATTNEKRIVENASLETM
jgi:hypothetical protein